MNKLPRHFALMGTLLASALAGAQPLPRLNNMTPAVTLVSPATIAPITLIAPVTLPCARAAQVFAIDDYTGPLNHLVSRFSQRLESTTVHMSRRRNDLRPCALSAFDKFHMFVERTADPLSYVGAAWDAATAQMNHDDPSYRQGAAAFGKRYGAAVTDHVSG